MIYSEEIAADEILQIIGQITKVAISNPDRPAAELTAVLDEIPRTFANAFLLVSSCTLSAGELLRVRVNAAGLIGPNLAADAAWEQRIVAQLVATAANKDEASHGAIMDSAFSTVVAAGPGWVEKAGGLVREAVICLYRTVAGQVRFLPTDAGRPVSDG